MFSFHWKLPAHAEQTPYAPVKFSAVVKDEISLFPDRQNSWLEIVEGNDSTEKQKVAALHEERQQLA